MTAADNSQPRSSDWKKKESFGSALMQIGIAGLVLAGAVYITYSRGATRKAVAEHLKEARTIAMRDNPADLHAALAELDKLFAVDSSAADGLAVAASLHTELWVQHKVASEEAKAKELLERAEKADSKAEERFGAHAQHLLAQGKAAEADAYIDQLRQKGASSARLWLNVGLAQKELGNLNAAKAALAQATDKAWKDPRFATAYGEALLDEGLFFQATEIFKKANAANPEHFRSRLGLALTGIYRKDRVKDAADTVADLLSREAELTPALKARALAVKAELANFEGRYDDAMKAADESLAVNADEYVALYAKARALGLKKDPAAADAFKAAVAKRSSAPAIYFEGALLLQSAGNHDGAMALLGAYEATFKNATTQLSDGKQVPVLDRDDRYWLTRGDVLKQADKLDEALASYEKAIAAQNVNLTKAYYAKGAVLLAKQEYDKAMEVLTEITPPDGSGSLGEAYVAMGEALFAKKDFAPGCQNYAFALAKFKNVQTPREQLNELLESVNKKLIAANQKPMAKLWMEEAKPLIQ